MRYKILSFCLFGLLIAYALINIKSKGDFYGYVEVGNMAINGNDIYTSIYNSWPPAFSFFSIPLAWLNSVNYYFIRALWMIFILLCFLFSIKVMIELLEQKQITYSQIFTEYCIKPWFCIALLLCCRGMMDNIMYLQINVPMLASCLWILKEKKQKIATFVLGVSIANKVYNIFLIPLMIIFKQWNKLVFTLLGLVFFTLMSFVFFGFDNAMHLYQHWFTQVASVKHEIVHRDQSLMASFHRLFNIESYAVNQQMPIISLAENSIKKIAYLFLLVLGSLYFIVFKRQLFKPNPYFIWASYIIAITAIPLLTPVAWKANYIYALPAIFYLVYSYFKQKPHKAYLVLFAFAMFCLTFSAEVFLGREAMYWLEKQNVMPIGQIVLYILLLIEVKRNIKTQAL